MSLLEPKDKHSILDEVIIPALICLVMCSTIAYFTSRPAPLTTSTKATPQKAVVEKPASIPIVTLHPLALAAQKQLQTEISLQDDLTQFIIPQMPLFAQLNRALNIVSTTSEADVTRNLNSAKQTQMLLFSKAEQLKRRILYFLTGELITDFSSYSISIKTDILRVERSVNWKANNVSSRDQYIVLLTSLDKVKEALAKTSINEPEPDLRAP